MKLFIIQNQKYDFCYEIQNACEYENWYRNENIYLVKLVEDCTKETIENIIHLLPHNIKQSITQKDIIPVGSVEFVQKFYNLFFNIKEIKPIGIPKELCTEDFLKRHIYEYNNEFKSYVPIVSQKTTSCFDKNKEYFIKENKIKGITDIGTINTVISNNKYSNFIISDIVEIESEYRCFVYNNKLLDCRCYGGDFKILPDFTIIDKMIKCYTNQSYTLDVGITNKKETIVIECHDFFSCGLYGFSDYSSIIKMLLATHRKIIG